MIRFIKVEDTLPLRSAVLQKGKALELCINPEDLKPDSFHLGLYDDENILQCVLTVHKTNHPKLPHEGYRLRGMATQPDARRKGYAKELLGAAKEHIKTQLHGDYLWCIAREIAYPFYLEMGFEFFSDEFEYKDAGKHKEMYIPFY
ncbi:N-acetyltransferase [Sphingobacterium mizutaii NBRC 14946 = DSM 11724]|uniref:Acetyltransferase (GNAT) family n=2 Tax=Sphingobacterium mizutaii TaxID=1010 RepID=A0AAJ4XBS1_9SPHI|nr:GNAT family N-acetyltransferase [Sphingobacterium mizutaii]GEM68875.1 N-acetyltransferase [Sphingobacterium mizutaii NBRC 14946 = DSM 11724]SDK89585.1 Acetyltransferase (GNAT) domain-containing protein [Sphingobacterium mizutaii]SNV46981.1 Acetyltransferase (GNAT) family [Sphingobacterium mizutaii]